MAKRQLPNMAVASYTVIDTDSRQSMFIQRDEKHILILKLLYYLYGSIFY